MSKVIQYYYVRGRYTDGATLLGYFPAGSKEQAIEKAKQEWVKSNAKIGVFFQLQPCGVSNAVRRTKVTVTIRGQLNFNKPGWPCCLFPEIQIDQK